MKPKDQIRIGREIAPGQRESLRRHGDEIKTGVFGGLKEGQPIPNGAELISVGEPNHDGWRDMNVLYSHPRRNEAVEEVAAPAEAPRTGPTQVATPAYRESYDRIFGKKQKVGLA